MKEEKYVQVLQQDLHSKPCCREFSELDNQKEYLHILEEENKQLLEIIEQQRCFRHDLSNHLSCISGLIDVGDYAYRRTDGVYVVPIGCLRP